MENDQKENVISCSIKKKCIFEEENTNKKIKLEVDKLNKTNNNYTSNLPSPPKECIYTMNEYDLISKENEEVAKVLEYIFKNENINIIDEIEKSLNNNIKWVINTLYDKIENIKRTKVLKSIFEGQTNLPCKNYEALTKRIINKYVDFTDLTTDERKVLMFFKLIFEFSSDYKQFKDIFKMTREKIGKDTLSKLTSCMSYHPYGVYGRDIIRVDSMTYEYYYKYFNYETLYKLNVTMYSNLYIINDKKFFFTTIEKYLRKLRELNKRFIFYECDKNNQDLLNRFIELQNKFPELDM